MFAAFSSFSFLILVFFTYGSLALWATPQSDTNQQHHRVAVGSDGSAVANDEAYRSMGQADIVGWEISPDGSTAHHDRPLLARYDVPQKQILAMDRFQEGSDDFIHSEALHVQCAWDKAGDAAPQQVRKGLESRGYGKCVDASGEVHYVIENDETDKFGVGEWLSLLLEKIHTLDSTLLNPHDDAHVDVYKISSFSRLPLPSGIGEHSYMMRRQRKGKALAGSQEAHAFIDQSDALNVVCTWENVNEDVDKYSEGKDVHDLDFSVCVLKDGKEYYVVADEVTRNFETDDVMSLTLEVTTPPKIPGKHLSPPWETKGVKIYKVIRSRKISGVEFAEVAANTTDVVTANILVVRVKFTDNEPTMSEATLWRDLFAKKSDTQDQYIKAGLYTGSIADMFEKSTYGQLILSESQSMVVTAELNEEWGPPRNTSCPDMGGLTTKAFAVLKQRNIDAASFNFREIVIPDDPWQGCGWAGLGVVGCTSLQNMRKGCTVWNRIAIPFVRVHEIGHNLGFFHTIGADETSAMGNSWKLTDYLPYDRHTMGALREDLQHGLLTGQSGTQSGAVTTLSSISQPLGHNGAQYAAIKYPCPRCRSLTGKTNKTGGELWVWFRGQQGYSGGYESGIGVRWTNKVYVVWELTKAHKHLGAGAERYKVLGALESFDGSSMLSPSVYVCSISNEVAEVAMAASVQAARQRCSGGGLIEEAQVARTSSWRHELMDAMKATEEEMGTGMNDFSSKAAMQENGWRFHHTDSNSNCFKPQHLAYGPRTVPNFAWYGLSYAKKSDGKHFAFALSHSMPSSGTLVLHYGNAALSQVTVYLNGQLKARTSYYWDVASFPVNAGDEVKIAMGNLPYHSVPLVSRMEIHGGGFQFDMKNTYKGSGSGGGGGGSGGQRPPPPPKPRGQTCEDKEEHCAYWKGEGFCIREFKQWMEENCCESCRQ